MAYEVPGGTIGTHTAVGNYSSATSQFCVVQSTAAGTFSKQTSVTGAVLGVLQDLPSSGYVGLLQVTGITKVRVNSTSHTAIVGGNKLCASTDAGAINSTTVGRYVIGRALEGLAANTTGIITMLLTHEGAGSTAGASGP